MYENGDQVRINREPSIYTVVISGHSGVCIIQREDAESQRVVHQYTLELVAKAETPSLRQNPGNGGTAEEGL
jgi:hypothetical protein